MGNIERQEGVPGADELLELDLDVRMHEVVLSALAVTEWSTSLTLNYLRYSFGAGYFDALTEPVQGSLYLARGHPLPRRRV